MRAIADNLIHFLGKSDKNNHSAQLDIFKLIIQKGLKLSPITINFGDAGWVKGNCVCFTDIPLYFCDEHTSVYGKFGIGYKKSFVKKVGGNPAMYHVDYSPILDALGLKVVEPRGLMSLNLSMILKSLVEMQNFVVNNENNETDGLYDNANEMKFSYSQINILVRHLIRLLSFEKPMGDLGPPRDEAEDTDVYYQEREWRIVPFQDCESTDYYETIDGSTYVKFRRNDVRVVIVPSNEIRLQTIEWFKSLSEETDERLIEFSKDIPVTLVYDDLKYY